MLSKVEPMPVRSSEEVRDLIAKSKQFNRERYIKQGLVRTSMEPPCCTWAKGLNPER